MKYDPISSALFIKNRKKFMAAMKPKSVAVFNSNDIYPISADSTMPFQQHRDILYLSGVDQEESILLLFPDAINPENKEVLFVRETNEHIAIWEGEKLTKEKATPTDPNSRRSSAAGGRQRTRPVFAGLFPGERGSNTFAADLPVRPKFRRG